MARLLRNQIQRLQERVEELEGEVRDWGEVGKVLLKVSHYKKISYLLKETKWLVLLINLKIREAQEDMSKRLGEALFK